MVYIGTSGWAYSWWKPEFYPADMPSSRFLSFYSTELNAVEVNYTFCGRHVLSRGRPLAGADPRQFSLCVSPDPSRSAISTATVCETRKPGWASSDWRYARSRINRLGPVLFQLPRTFTIDPAVLEDFLRNWPRGLRVSFEFRHPSWFTDALMKFCAIIGRDFVWPKGMRWHHREF